ncbi:tetratricopeptide repeat protein [Kitasatospora purpeofusca]|uniref:tetratricopeptide repeat protein n=1 Tax=Kitasatospora purpeofusca TaxID=67352 RepID=UPI0036D33EF6
MADTSSGREDLSSSGRDNAGPGAVRVHRLVQRAVRDSAPARERRTMLLLAAAYALFHAWPKEDHHDRELAAILRANTDTLTALGSDVFWISDRAHPLLFRAGASLLKAGLYATAVTRWQHLTATAERVLGPHHPDTLTARTGLASSYQDAGRTDEAILILEQVVAEANTSSDPTTPTPGRLP